MKSTVSPLPASQVSLYFAAIFAFLYLRTFMLPGTPLIASGDETMFFIHGFRILHGQVPFRDYFAFVMPGADLFYAAAFRILGIHAWMASAFVIGLGTTIAAVLLRISRSVLSGSTVFLPGLLFVVLDFDTVKDATHHWYNTLFMLGAVAILLGGRSLRRIFLAGALCGLAVIFTQSQGVLGATAILISLLWSAPEDSQPRAWRLGAFIAPFLAIPGGMLGYYIYRAGFATIYSSLVTFVFHGFPSLRAHTPYAYLLQVPPRSSVMLMLPYLFIHLFLPFGYLFCLYRLWRIAKDRPEAIDLRAWQGMVLINLVGLALFAAVANGPTYRRMVMVAPPATVVCVWLFAEGAGRKARTLRVWILRALWAGAIVFLAVRPLQQQRHWRSYLDLPTGRTAITDPDNYLQLQWFVQHTHPGESFFYNPQLTFALELDNPTTVDYATPSGYTTPQQVDDAIRGLQRDQTPLVAFYDVLYKPAPEMFAPHRPRIDSMGPFYAYVYRNYHLAKVLPGMTVWERNSIPPANSVDR